MQTASIRRNAFRSLLALHFIGLALSIGARFADFVIERQTANGTLQILALGRDLTGVIAGNLVLPGFLIMVGTGIAMTLLRYGRRPPIWVWTKVSLNLIAYFVAFLFVVPALAAARQWSHWSVEHNQLSPQFQHSATQATLYGAIVFALFLLNVPVAIWKPFSSVRLSRGARRRDYGVPKLTLVSLPQQQTAEQSEHP
jgi:hypothetical protein